MLKPNLIEDIIAQIMNGLPEGLRNLPEDLRANLKLSLQGALAKLDLVTREEFDTQVAVLKRTRQKLDELETLLKQQHDKQ